MEIINIPNQPYDRTMGYTMDPNTQQYLVQDMNPYQSINPYFNTVPYPMGVYIPNTYSFGQFVSTEKQNEQSMNSFNTTNLVRPQDNVSQPVGLPMNVLVEASTEPVQNENVYQETKVQFCGLVTQAPVQNQQQKFALQPIPEDLDRSMLPKPSLIEDAINEVNTHINNSNKSSKNESVGKRKINNWFTRLLDQKGENYISSGKLTIDEVSRNAERILDDMIAGRIDYGKQGQYIIQPIIIDTLINYCSNKLAINRAIQFSLGYVYNDYTLSMDNRISPVNDPDRLSVLGNIDDSLSRNITQAIAIVNQDIGIYDILYKKLTFVEFTKNASSLFSLTNDLNNFKKQIKKRY